MSNRIIENGDETIGYTEDIIEETKEYMYAYIQNEDYDALDAGKELLECLCGSEYQDNNSFIRVRAHPMGGFNIECLMTQDEWEEIQEEER